MLRQKYGYADVNDPLQNVFKDAVVFGDEVQLLITSPALTVGKSADFSKKWIKDNMQHGAETNKYAAQKKQFEVTIAFMKDVNDAIDDYRKANDNKPGYEGYENLFSNNKETYDSFVLNISVKDAVMAKLKDRYSPKEIETFLDSDGKALERLMDAAAGLRNAIDKNTISFTVDENGQLKISPYELFITVAAAKDRVF